LVTSQSMGNLFLASTVDEHYNKPR
jgi:hypothetical protein